MECSGTALLFTAFIIRAMMKAVRTSETSVNIYLTTPQYIPEDFKLHSCHNLTCICIIAYTVLKFNNKKVIKTESSF
jgi:hypothetical protein